jgi:hypothetical protein
MDAFSNLCPRISVLRAAKPDLPLSLLAAWFYFFGTKIRARLGIYAYQKPTSHLQPIQFFHATVLNLSAIIYCSLQI